MKLTDRGVAYARYLQLVQEQSQALESGDLPLFGDLAQQRDDLAAAIDVLPPPADPAGARELIGRCLEVDGIVRRRLGALRDELRNRMRDTDLRRPALAPYLAAQAAGARLDRVS